LRQQDGRPVDERARQRHALLLAAGQLPGAAPAEAGEPHQLQRPVDLLGDLLLRRLGRPLPQAVGDVVRHGHVREERVVLEHHVDGALVGRHADHRDAADQDMALRGLLEAGEQAQRGGLAAARRPQEAEEGAAFDAQGHVVDGDDLAEALRGPHELDVRGPVVARRVRPLDRVPAVFHPLRYPGTMPGALVDRAFQAPCCGGCTAGAAGVYIPRGI
jgi:hypothetical protein